MIRFGDRPPRVAFVGAGRAGATLAEAFSRAGLEVTAVASRNRARAEAVASRLPGVRVAATAQEAAGGSDLVFLTVGDDAIVAVCASVAWRPEQAVVHCSGALAADALAAAARAGAAVGAFHPMQMFASPAVALETLPGCTITIDAAPPLDEVLEEITRRIGCRPLRLPPEHRALYHASAYYVGPFLIALMQEAARMWEAFGVGERDTLAALVPLLRGTVAAVVDGGLAQGMGGCVARGDVGTIRRHLAALEVFSPEAASLYRQLALRTIPLGLARGTLGPDAAGRIRAVLEAPVRPDAPGATGSTATSG